MATDVCVTGKWTRRVNRGGTYTNASPATVSNSVWYTVRDTGVGLSVKYNGLSPRNLFNDTSGSWTETATWNYYATYSGGSFSNKIRTDSKSVTMKWSRTVQDYWSSGSTTLTYYTAYYPGTTTIVESGEVSSTLTANTSYSDWSDTTNSYTFPTTQDYWNTINSGNDNGYKVTGWKTTNSAYSANTYNPGQTVTSVRYGTFNWYPVTRANSYTITLKYNYTGAPSDSSVSVTYNSACSNLTTPTRTGYTFKEWNDKADGTGTKYTTSTTYTTVGNKTLYAQWTANKYTLTANANGGTIPTTSGWTIASDSKTATKSVTYGSAYSTLPTPTRTGYQFDGWYTTASGGSSVSSSTTMGAAETTIYARWAEGLKVIFNLKGGTKDGDSYPEEKDAGGHTIKIYRIMKVNTSNNIEMYPPVRSGYLFQGYFTRASGGTKVYEWRSPTTTYGIESTGYWQSSKWVNTTNNLTLYAQWIPATIYVYNGGWQAVRPYAYNGGWQPVHTWGAYSGGWIQKNT